MKKFFRVLTVCLLALLTVAFCGCVGWCGRYEEDVIPEKFGAPEGFWLYSGNQRSYTDGSNKQTLLAQVEIEGNTYQDFTVKTFAYVKSTSEIFMVIEVEEAYHICHYNYKSKAGGHLYALPSYGREKFVISGNYVFLNTENAGIVFDLNAKLVDDCFQGYTLDGGVLYLDEKTSYGKFIWFTDGEFKSVDRSLLEWQCEYWVYGDYCYANDYYGKIQAINLKTGEITNLAPLMEQTRYTKFKYYTNGALYIVSLMGGTHNYYLHKITGTEVKLIKDLGEAAYGNGLEISLYDGKLYFKKLNSRGHIYKYKFNPQNDKYSKVTSIPTAEISDYKDKVGNYTFYVDYETYTGYGDGWGFPMQAKCYYLYRKRKNKKEIMQYSLSSPHFYDDLCEF